jgi:hypothetical protein
MEATINIDPTLINGTTTDVDAIKAAFESLEKDGFRTGFGKSMRAYKKAVFFPADRFGAFSGYNIGDLQYNLLMEVSRKEWLEPAVAAFEAQELTVMRCNGGDMFYVQPFMDAPTRGMIRNWQKCRDLVTDYDTAVNQFAEACDELLTSNELKDVHNAASTVSHRAHRIAYLRRQVEDTIYGPNYTSIKRRDVAAMTMEAWLILWDGVPA